MKTFHTPTGKAGSDLVDAMEESVHSHLEQMFGQSAKSESLVYGVGRATMKFQDSGGAARLEAQRRECQAQIVSHAGRALELALHILYARGTDRIIGRGYPGMSEEERRRDFAGGHSLTALYERIVREVAKLRLEDALEFAYQHALHKGVTDIYVEDELIGSVFLAGESPFSERSTSRMSDGEEHTMDHSDMRGLFAQPDGTSRFAQMPIDTFKQFLMKADAVYYEDDAPRTRGRRRNMRWGNYAARDHESARPFVTVGVRFFGRLVQEVVQVGHQAWTWESNHLARALARRRYTVMARLKDLAMQNLVGEVQWPDMISDEKALEYFLHPYDGPVVGKGDYEHLHGALRWGERVKVPTNKTADGELIRQIRRAVAKDLLKEPFRAADVRRAGVRCAATTPGTFLSKHRVGNGNTTELFVRVGRGLYKLNRA